MNTAVDKNLQTLLGDDYVEIWVRAFLVDRKTQNLSKNSIRFYQTNLKVFVSYLDSQEIKYISQVTPSVIRDFLLLLEEKGHTEGGIHTFFRSVKVFLRWYWEEAEPGYTNPISKIKSPKLTPEPLRGISREEFDALLSECGSGFLGERDKAILKVFLDTGIRANELCNIRLIDVNLVENSIFVLVGKGRKPRYVFFGKSTRKQLRKYLRYRGTAGSYLFTNRTGDKLVYNALRQILRRLCFKAGIEGISLHDFRRAFCLECLRRGMPEITISRLMGHSTTQLIGVYAKQTTTDLQNSYKSPLDD